MPAKRQKGCGGDSKNKHAKGKRKHAKGTENGPVILNEVPTSVLGTQ
jgi:hypothetical protein